MVHAFLWNHPQTYFQCLPDLSLVKWRICISKLNIIGSDNGLSPGWHQAIIWTNDGILLIGTLETNFSEIFIEIHIFSLKKIHLKMSSAKWQPFCVRFNMWKYTLALYHNAHSSCQHHRSHPADKWSGQVSVNSLTPGRCGSNFKSIISSSLYRIVALVLIVK